MADPVNHPAHYNTGTIEVIDAIEDWSLGFHLGNAVKYIARAGRKGDALDDLKKARWYLEREIQRIESPGLTSKQVQAEERQCPVCLLIIPEHVVHCQNCEPRQS